MIICVYNIYIHFIRTHMITERGTYLNSRGMFAGVGEAEAWMQFSKLRATSLEHPASGLRLRNL